MTYITYPIQAVEPEKLARQDGIIIVTLDEPDSMGHPTVLVAAKTREALVAYCKSQWPEDDDWFQAYVVANIYGSPTPFNELAGYWAHHDPRPPAEEARTILVHLNVAAPASDTRTANEIADALMAALEVGADDESVRELIPAVALAEEI